MRKAQFDQLTAANFCRENFPVLESTQTVQTALELFSADNKNLTILISGEKKKAIGCLSAEKLLLYLFEDSITELDNGIIPDDLEARLASQVGILPLEPLIWVEKSDPLPILLLRARQDCSEWLVVRDEPDQDQAKGLIYLSELYQTAASLALSTEKNTLPFAQESPQPRDKTVKAKTTAPKTGQQTSKPKASSEPDKPGPETAKQRKKT